ncbi:uncharacterized protein BYT42DRAFT_563902 [Radiomyces spectabilis]|uniref:uncharacterized protein n=1 Tax=Radiomyces spectabilis TaxID=64574 RepID=UPI0022203A30|nr:uncharacterized protein BYT42DRAFT_563902 [Radiomyces spectabilis]KAI8384867.1 hypothetical protein BYT42DRAFT_563902 [Radiomyces spectabilis]
MKLKLYHQRPRVLTLPFLIFFFSKRFMWPTHKDKALPPLTRSSTADDEDSSISQEDLNALFHVPFVRQVYEPTLPVMIEEESCSSISEHEDNDDTHSGRPSFASWHDAVEHVDEEAPAVEYPSIANSMAWGHRITKPLPTLSEKSSEDRQEDEDFRAGDSISLPMTSTSSESSKSVSRHFTANVEYNTAVLQSMFHPHSTFVHHTHNDEVSYEAWSPPGWCTPAARLAKRFQGDIQPRPSLPFSPTGSSEGLTDPSPRKSGSVAAEESFYYDILRKIRDPNSTFNSWKSDKIDDISLASSASLTLAKTSNSSALLSLLRNGPIRLGHAITARMQHDRSSRRSRKDNEIDVESKPEGTTENADVVERATAPVIERRLFWLGFLFPPLWFYCTFRRTSDSNTICANQHLRLQWQRRCRIAGIAFIMTIAVIALVIFAKLRGMAGSRRIPADQIPAVIFNFNS